MKHLNQFHRALTLSTIIGALACTKGESNSKTLESADTSAPAMAMSPTPSTAIHLCLTQEIGRPFATRAQATAETENAKNSINSQARVLGIPDRVARKTVSSEVWAALATSKRWAPGRRLRIRFLNGDALLQQRVFDAAAEWQRFANVSFIRSSDPNSEIRIRFTGDNASWSRLGTDVQFFPPSSHTMQFGWLSTTTPDDSLRAVVLHEFGHALGLIHEHQQPAAAIPWDTAAVYKWYAERGWDSATVNEQVFHRSSGRETQYSQFDPASIVLYPIPSELTRGVVTIGWNSQLSPTDVRYIGCWYFSGPRPASTCPPGTR
jgi:serralysin